MNWTKSNADGVTKWTSEEGARVIAASDKGVFALVGQRLGRFIKGERRLLELLAQVCDDDTESVLLEAWQAHVHAVIERDAPLIPQLTDEAPLRMPRKGDFA
jgi:hypothetical protein